MTDERIYTIVGVDYPRIRYGDEKRFGPDWHDTVARQCHDCGTAPGAYHMPGCDMEECPRCGGQSISCDCEDEELPYLRAEVERLHKELAEARVTAAAEIHEEGHRMMSHDRNASLHQLLTFIERKYGKDMLASYWNE